MGSNVLDLIRKDKLSHPILSFLSRLAQLLELYKLATGGSFPSLATKKNFDLESNSCESHYHPPLMMMSEHQFSLWNSFLVREIYHS